MLIQLAKPRVAGLAILHVFTALVIWLFWDGGGIG